MNKIDPVVLKETKYILKWNILFSVILQAVFLVVQKWDYTVLLGSIFSLITATGNFLFMGLTIQKAVGMPEERARSFIKVSQTYRMLGLIVFAVVGVAAPCFDMWAVVAGLFFPRIAILIRPFLDKNQSKKS